MLAKPFKNIIANSFFSRMGKITHFEKVSKRRQNKKPSLFIRRFFCK